MIVVTGGAGFIGSACLWRLNQEGIKDILVVDDLDRSDKWKNLVNRQYEHYLDHQEFLALVKQDQVPGSIEAVIHMGACSATTERDSDYLMRNNYQYTRTLAEWAIKKNIRFIYASSAATYGDGQMGYLDDEVTSLKLKPLNMYGYSKQLFDLWAIRSKMINQIAGLKFFNVYGPNEYHKEDMRSVVHKAFGQIKDKGQVNLFKSYRPDYADGEQVRDFIYVKDVVEVIWWLLKNSGINGLYNLGTGHARSWKDLAYAVFTAMAKAVNIEFVDMPEHLKDRYQYRTEASMDKLRQAGFSKEFKTLEDGICDYIQSYLIKDDPYL